MSSTHTPLGEKAAPNAPLSPHLQIWRFTVTMAASITHRGTGVAMFAGTALLAAWLYTAAAGEEAFGPIGALLSGPLGVIIIAGYTWTICFHMLNGLRYLYWDSGRGFGVETAKKTAWAVYTGSFLLTVIILMAGFSARGGA